MPGIGLLNERSLHSSLKEWYARPDDELEVAVDGYVIDIVRGDLLIEIQTTNLSAIRAKLTNLARSHRVHLVYPVAWEKWIVRLPNDATGTPTRRKSPRRGRVEDLFWEMVSIPDLLANANFALEVVMIREEEVRRFRWKRNWRKRGWGVDERRLLEVLDQKRFEEPADWLALLPEELSEFTARDLAEAIDVRTNLAQKMVYCLRQVGTIDMIGKRGRANLYRVNGA